MNKDFSELIEYLDKKFEKTTTKENLADLVTLEEFNKRMGNFEKEFKDFKNESLTNQDVMLKKIDTLFTEKTVKEYQEKKEKKLLAIIIKSLKEHRILSSKELEEIAQLEIF
ncbi:MAG: hypothetical protein WBC21_01970 [Minisyncoccales bacterium]